MDFKICIVFGNMYTWKGTWLAHESEWVGLLDFWTFFFCYIFLCFYHDD